MMVRDKPALFKAFLPWNFHPHLKKAEEEGCAGSICIYMTPACANKSPFALLGIDQWRWACAYIVVKTPTRARGAHRSRDPYFTIWLQQPLSLLWRGSFLFLPSSFLSLSLLIPFYRRGTRQRMPPLWYFRGRSMSFLLNMAAHAKKLDFQVGNYCWCSKKYFTFDGFFFTYTSFSNWANKRQGCMSFSLRKS